MRSQLGEKSSEAQAKLVQATTTTATTSTTSQRGPNNRSFASMNTQMGCLSMMASLFFVGLSWLILSSSWVESIHLDIGDSDGGDGAARSQPGASPTPDFTTKAPLDPPSSTARPGKHLPHIDPSMIDHLMHQLEPPASITDGLLKVGQQIREKLKKFIDRFIAYGLQQQQHGSLSSTTLASPALASEAQH